MKPAAADLHQYSDSPDLPHPTDYQIGKPIILGEYGQSEGKGQDQQATSTKMFLQQAHDRGWNGTMIWAFDFPKSPKEHRLMNADGSLRPAAVIIRDFANKLTNP